MLENDVKNKQGKYEGVYTFQGFDDGMDYWVPADGVHAIWYKASGSTYYWIIGYLHNLGTSSDFDIFSRSNTLEKKCPNNEGYILSWIYWSGSNWIATNDVDIKCANENDFCTSVNPCVSDQGDCDTHDECQDVLACGSNNCPDSLGFHSEFDCCYYPSIGDEHFCTNNNPCAEDEGDCDSNTECETNLICDVINSCPAHLGFASDVNCCLTSGCKFVEIILYLGPPQVKF